MGKQRCDETMRHATFFRRGCAVGTRHAVSLQAMNNKNLRSSANLHHLRANYKPKINNHYDQSDRKSERKRVGHRAPCSDNHIDRSCNDVGGAELYVRVHQTLPLTPPSMEGETMRHVTIS